MTCVSDLASLRRPRLLMQAARLGIEAYARDRDLCRVLRIGSPPSPDRALRWLMAEEDAAEARRRAGDGDYSSRRHVDLLIALLAEARLALTPR